MRPPHALHMSFLTHKGLLAIATVVDIALNARAGRLVRASALAERHGLPPRHLELLLQTLARHGILRSTRGSRGGYALARDPHRISIEDIVRTATTLDEVDAALLIDSALVRKVVMPALTPAGRAFSAALACMNVDELARSAEKLWK
jgi:Rrf2 family transcriptional regulator, iron-sulfur cluster assembly transcription factor